MICYFPMKEYHHDNRNRPSIRDPGTARDNPYDENIATIQHVKNRAA